MFEDFGMRLPNSLQANRHVLINDSTSTKGAAIIAILNPLVQAHDAKNVPALQLYCSFILEIRQSRSTSWPIRSIVVFMKANAAAQVLMVFYQLGFRWCVIQGKIWTARSLVDGSVRDGFKRV